MPHCAWLEDTCVNRHMPGIEVLLCSRCRALALAACCGMTIPVGCCAHHKGKDHAANWVDKQQLCSHAPHKEAEIARMPDVPAHHGLPSAEKAAPS